MSFTPITVIPDDVTAALLKAANSQLGDIDANALVAAAQTALAAAQAGVTTAQTAEVAAHTQATNDTNAAAQAVQTWIQSLTSPAPIVAPPADAADPNQQST